MNIDVNVDKEKMQKMWVKKYDGNVEEEIKYGSTITIGVDSSFEN